MARKLRERVNSTIEKAVQEETVGTWGERCGVCETHSIEGEEAKEATRMDDEDQEPRAVAVHESAIVNTELSDEQLQ